MKTDCQTLCLGCQVEIWEETESRGDYFTCPGDDDGDWCHSNSLGTVGNDKASTIKCTCPVEFESIEYDTPREDWDLDLDWTSAVVIDELVVTNTCNPAYTLCSDTTLSSTQSKTVKAEHNWGYVFKAGVSYTPGASASFIGVGDSEPITISAEVPQSNGGSYEIDQTVSSTRTKCVAKPMTKVNCKYFAYKGTIEVGYTIYWKNASPTRGTYRGQEWRSVFSQAIQRL